MRGFALIVCVASLAIVVHGLTHGQKRKLKIIHKECQKDPATHVNKGVLKRAYHNGEDPPEIGVYVLCVSKKLGFQTDSGDVANIRSKVSPYVTDEAKLNEIVEKCGVQKDTPEETARHIVKCFHGYVGHYHVDHHWRHHRRGHKKHHDDDDDDDDDDNDCDDD